MVWHVVLCGIHRLETCNLGNALLYPELPELISPIVVILLCLFLRIGDECNIGAIDFILETDRLGNLFSFSLQLL